MKKNLRNFYFVLFIFSLFVSLPVLGEEDLDLKILKFMLIDAQTNEELFEIEDGSKINLATIGTRHINIRGYTEPNQVGSVVFELSGMRDKVHIENIEPYSLYKNDGKNFFKWSPSPGNYKLKATPYSKSEAKGEKGASLSVSFTIKDGFEVVGFFLVNADNDKELFEITEEMEIDLSELPTENINIRALTDPKDVGSVEISIKDLKDDTFYSHTENANPYAIFSDHKGDYYGRSPINGSFMISATPYKLVNGRGEAGYSLKRKFSFINESKSSQRVSANFLKSEKSLDHFAVFPNPGRNVLNLYFDDHHYGEVLVTLYDLMGNEILNKNKKAGSGNVNIMLDVSELESKPYIIKLVSSEKGVHQLRWMKE